MPKRPSETPPLRNPGDIIVKKYTVARQIGKGASGEVYVVADKERGGELIALKYLKLDPAILAALENFKSEFSTLTHLNHPHIAKVFDFGLDEAIGYYYFTSELIDGFDFVTSSIRLDIEQIELLLIQSLRALEYLHGHNIFHYDIKPQNILVLEASSPAPMVKVIDFGLASKTPPKRLIGTPSYIAPEIIEKKTPDGRADLYSLGVLTYYALTGVNPFKDKSAEDTLNNHLTVIPIKPTELNNAIPEYLSAIIMKLLEKKPEDRYNTPSDVIRDLNLRSQRFFAIETPDTLLSYVPWEGPFIGRQAEIALFKSWLTPAETDPAESVFIVRGSVGCGKSRFVDECKNTAQLLNFNTLVTNAIDFKFLKKLEEKRPPSLIIIEEADAAVAGAAPENVNLLKEALKGSHLLITLEDKEPLKEILARFSQQLTREIVLSHFNIRDLKEYICTLTGLKEAPTWLVLSLHKYTGGNPLFLTETIKEIIAKGLLFDQGGRWKKSTMEDLGVDLSHLKVPDLVCTKILAQLDLLPEEERAIVALVAIASEALSEELIKNCLPKITDELIRNLIDKNWINFNPENDTYAMKTTIVKRAAHFHLPPDKKQHYHDLLKNYLAVHQGNGQEILYHTQRGSNAKTARSALLEGIYKTSETPTGDGLIDEFLERFGNHFDEDIFRIMEIKARGEITSRKLKQAHQTYKALFEKLPPEAEAPQWHFEVHIDLGSLYKRERNIEGATTHLTEAQRLSEKLEDPAAPIIVGNHFAGLDLITGNTDAAIKKFAAARDTAKEIGDDDNTEVFVNDLGLAYFYKGDYKNAVSILEKDVEVLRPSGNHTQLCRSLHALGESYRLLRQYNKAEAAFKELMQMAKAVRDIDRLFRAYDGMGNVLSDEGNYTDSIGYCERALDLAIHTENYDAIISTMTNTAIINSNINNVKKAFDTFQTALSFLEHKDFPVSMRELYLCRIHLELGELCRLQKNFTAAEEHLSKALELAKTPQGKLYLFWVLITEAKLAKDRQEKKTAKDFINQAKRLVDSSQKKILLKETKKYRPA